MNREFAQQESEGEVRTLPLTVFTPYPHMLKGVWPLNQANAEAKRKRTADRFKSSRAVADRLTGADDDDWERTETGEMRRSGAGSETVVDL